MSKYLMKTNIKIGYTIYLSWNIEYFIRTKYNTIYKAMLEYQQEANHKRVNHDCIELHWISNRFRNLLEHKIQAIWSCIVLGSNM